MGDRGDEQRVMIDVCFFYFFKATQLDKVTMLMSQLGSLIQLRLICTGCSTSNPIAS